MIPYMWQYNRIPAYLDNRFVFSSVQLLSHVRLFVTPWTTACQTFLSITNSWSSPKLMSIESVMPSNHLILCCPLLLLTSIFPNIRVFSTESALRIRWPKYWSFSFNISPSNEHPRVISFRMDWLDLLAVQGTVKSLLQHLSSKASILQCSAFFIIQLSHLYMTTGKTIALTRWGLLIPVNTFRNFFLFFFFLILRKGLALIEISYKLSWQGIYFLIQAVFMKVAQKKRIFLDTLSGTFTLLLISASAMKMTLVHLMMQFPLLVAFVSSDKHSYIPWNLAEVIILCIIYFTYVA